MGVFASYLQEPVEGGEHDGHGELVGVDEGQGLGHGDEHLNRKQRRTHIKSLPFCGESMVLL